MDKDLPLRFQKGKKGENDREINFSQPNRNYMKNISFPGIHHNFPVSR